MIGQLLLHYEVIQKLGQGGMGVVYKARDTHLDRFVAIKVLPPDKVADPQRKARFVQEAKCVSALNHPNIVVVHDIARDNGIDFIAMEYVPGKTLDQLIPRAGMRLGEALKIAIQIADALARAHSAGIVHRDLKPSNVMVNEQGNVKVLDFGLAKLTEQGSSENYSTATIGVETAAGTIVGTGPYMSPEQAEGKEVDGRSDIFSFGSLLYEMVSGRRAFQGDSHMATLSAILQKEPKPLVEGVPADLEKLIARCLRKDPARRIQHMDDVRLSLEDLRDESVSGAISPVRSGGNRRRMTLIAASLGVALIGGGVWFLARESRPNEGPSFPTPLTSYPGDEVEPDFSPDGNQVAFVWDGERQDNTDIYVKLIGAEKPLRLTTDPDDDISPAWSPDGRFIAFVRRARSGDRNAAVYVAPAIGGPERRVVELGSSIEVGPNSLHFIYVAPFPLVGWTRDSRSLLFADRANRQQPFEIFVITLDTGERRKITSAPLGVIGDGAPAVSRDGRTLLYSRALSMTSSDLYRLSLSGDLRPSGSPERLTSLKEWSATPVWLPATGDIIFSTGGKFDGPYRLWRMAAQAGSEPRRLASYEDGGWPAYSPDRGRLVFSRSMTDSNIWRAPLSNASDTGAATKLIASTREDAVPQYSPDGSKIAFTSNRSGYQEVWVTSSDGANSVQLTTLRAGVTGSPHWSPDGSDIVFDSNVEGQFEIYTVHSAGGSPRRLTNHRSDDAVASYSRDGRFIYFSSNRTGSFQVWKMAAEGGEPVQVTQQGGRHALETPDGKFIFYERTGQHPSLWKCPANGGLETEVSPSSGFLNFTMTEKGIYFLLRRDSDSANVIHFLDFSATTAKPVLAVSHPLATGLSVSPDGKFLLYSQIDQRGSDLMLVENFR